MIRFVTLLLTVAFACSGCSFSKTSRQQRAYDKYVRKSSVTREKQRSHFKSKKPAMPTSPMPTEPVQNSESGPQSVPPEDSQ